MLHAQVSQPLKHFVLHTPNHYDGSLTYSFQHITMFLAPGNKNWTESSKSRLTATE